MRHSRVQSGYLSPEEELVQDLLTITHVFSARLYGLWNYRKKFREALNADVSAQELIDPTPDQIRYFFSGQNNRPIFKKKGGNADSFPVANDKFHLEGQRVKLSESGWASFAKLFRLVGGIFGAGVVREADQWHGTNRRAVSDATHYRHCLHHDIKGVDVGVKSLATLSTGEKFEGLKALQRVLRRRLKIRQQVIIRKLGVAKEFFDRTLKVPIPKGPQFPRSRNWLKSQKREARTHCRVINDRRDFLHKTSPHLARAAADRGFGNFFAMLRKVDLGGKGRRYKAPTPQGLIEGLLLLDVLTNDREGSPVARPCKVTWRPQAAVP